VCTKFRGNKLKNEWKLKFGRYGKIKVQVSFILLQSVRVVTVLSLRIINCLLWTKGCLVVSPFSSGRLSNKMLGKTNLSFYKLLISNPK
jgi:hypothetical protein